MLQLCFFTLYPIKPIGQDVLFWPAQEAWNLYLGWESDDVGVPFHGRNLWPNAALVPGFHPAMTAYYHAMNGVAERCVSLLLPYTLLYPDSNG